MVGANKLAIQAAREGVTIDDLVNAALERNPTIVAAARDLQISKQALHKFLGKRDKQKAVAR